MFYILAALFGVIFLFENKNKPAAAKSVDSNSSTPTLVTSAPDWYASTGTGVTDDPPTTSSNLFPPAIVKVEKPPTLNNVYWNNPYSLPEIQEAKYQSDQASIAPLPPPNIKFESAVPQIASAVYKQSLQPETVTPRWLE